MTWFFDDTPVCLFVWAENAYTYKHLQLVEWIGGRRKLESGPPALSCSLRTLWLALKESEREGQRLFFLQPLSNIVIPLPLRCRIRFSFSFFFKKPCDVGFVLCFFFRALLRHHICPLSFLFPSTRSVSRLAHCSHKETSPPRS